MHEHLRSIFALLERYLMSFMINDKFNTKIFNFFFVLTRWHRNFVKLKEENNLTHFFEDFRNYLDMLLRRKVFEFWVGYRYPQFEFDRRKIFYFFRLSIFGI